MSTDPFLPYVSRVPLSWPDGAGPVLHWLEGTLLFVDVAGFTALSERLSKTGRAGAEELTELLDGAFARLLAAAYENGGSLLSFGGDALLLFFEGQDHPRRAAHAAGVMRRKPAELGALATSVGPVRLRLSMGAHSGRYAFLVSGSESRVVLLLGSDVSATVRLEQRATAGQVMVGPTLAAAVPEAVAEVVDGAALLLRTPRPPLKGNPHPLGEPVTPAARFLDPALRAHIAARPTSEHRAAAVGFVQLRGTDALLDLDPDRALAAVDEVVLATQRAAAEYGVTVLGSDVDGDGAKLILVAGAPVAAEHSEERLLRTCRAVLDLATPLQLRAGVTSGHVFVGDVGPAYRRAFTVMGERVNLAARLMASAEPGELRTTPKVLAASSTSFITTELEPLRLKGIAEPVAAVAIGAPVGQVHRAGRGDLLGREAEAAVLAEALAAARGGCGSCVEVVGEPGSGKTALLSAFSATSTSPTLRASAVPYEAETAFGLARRILRAVVGVDAEASPVDVGQRLSEALELLTPQDLGLVMMAGDAEPPAGCDIAEVVQDELLVQRLGRAVRRALSVLVPTTAVLVVEDLQWADPMSLALLKAVSDQLHEHPWLLCVSHRPSSAEPRALVGGRLVSLGPLDDVDATELVHRVSGQPMSSQRVTVLVARAGGNPMFLTELVRFGGQHGELPETIEAVVNARLDALPGYLRRLLRQASVLGAHFDLDLLGQLGGFVPDREEWRQLEGLLARAGSRGAFDNEVVRDVAYQSLPYRDRRALHSAAGQLLRDRGSLDVELLALHAAQAHDDVLTWQYAGEAGVRSLARGAHDQAVTAFRRALIAHTHSNLGPNSETQGVNTLLGDALVRAGSAREATLAYSKARALSPLGRHGDPVLCHKEALARIALGEHATARRWLTRGLDAATTDLQLPARLELLASQAGVMFRQGQYRGALRTLSVLIDLTEGTKHRKSNAHAHDLTLLVMSVTNDPRRAEHRTQAVEIYGELGDVQGLAKAFNNLGVDALFECRWDECVEFMERSREYEEQDANAVGAALSEINTADILLDQGRFDEVAKRLRRAQRTFQAENFRIGEAEVLKQLGRLDAYLGNAEDAARHLQEAFDLVGAMGAESMLPDVIAREAELAVLTHDLDGATHLLQELHRRSSKREELLLLRTHLLAAVEARQGRTAEAIELLRGVVTAEEGMHRHRAALARFSLSVLLGDDPEAATHRFAAEQTLAQLGVRQFRDPVAGDELVVLATAPVLVDLSEQPNQAAAV